MELSKQLDNTLLEATKSKRITKADLTNAALINKERIAEDIGNTLVLAPHPDDESLGCGGLIHMLIQAGKDVTVAFITNGSSSHLFSKEYPSDKLGNLRKKEATNACLKLGVPRENILFLNAQDGGLSNLDSEELEKLVHQIYELTFKRSFQTILYPWRRDPHPDHIITYEIGRKFVELYNKKLIALEYPIWLWKNGKTVDWPKRDEVHPIRLNISESTLAKQDAIQQHKSQLGLVIKDDPEGFVLTEDLLKPFTSEFEYFFTDINRGIESLSEKYFEEIYRENTDPWNFKNSSYEQKKYEQSIAALKGKFFENALEIGCSIGVQTNLFAEHCEQLLAIDISETAIEEAKKNCNERDNITFKVMNVANDFPHGEFDLITLCEVGYYLNSENLFKVFQNIDEALMHKGKLLAVHWLGFVPEYPLSGGDVHNKLEIFLSNKYNYQKIEEKKTEKYRLEVWEKN